MQRRDSIKTKAYKRKPTLTLARTATFNAARRYSTGYIPRAGEKKNIDNNFAATVVAAQATAVVLTLNASTRGTNPTQYVGRSIRMKSLLIRWNGSMAPTSAGASGLRLVVVYDKQANAAIPATTDVFVVDQMSSPMNLANNRRFKIVMDEEIDCIGTGGPQAWNIKRYVKLNLNTEYNQTNGGTIADITSGSLIAYFYQAGTIITAAPTNSFYSRIRFVDE